MTINIGRRRFRVSCWVANFNALFVDRKSFTEGDVYRVRLGRLMMKVMVDQMSTRDRWLAEQRAKSTLECLRD
jgi:hypothetical protein